MRARRGPAPAEPPARPGDRAGDPAGAGRHAHRPRARGERGLRRLTLGEGPRRPTLTQSFMATIFYRTRSTYLLNSTLASSLRTCSLERPNFWAVSERV